jgi:hemolysin III
MNIKEIKTELANAISHGFGILFAIVASPILLTYTTQKARPELTFAVALFCFSMLMIFTFSTLYHAFFNPEAKRVLRIFDHISIFFMIGGSYAPFIVLFTDASTAKWFFMTQWSLILIGVILKIFFTGRFRLFSSLVYIFIGCLVFFIGSDFWHKLPNDVFYLMIAGGLCYLVGAIFYQNRKIPYNHFIWHLFVLTAAVIHYFAILKAVS